MKALLCALLLVVFAGSTQAQSLEDKLENARTVARARIVLAQDEALRAFTFQPSMSGDVLTLGGAVETPAQKERAAELVRDIEGVRSVVNAIRVTHTSGPDLSDLPPAPPPTAEEQAAAKAQAEPEPEQVFHTVKRGDTVGAIARRYGVSIRSVQRLNGLRGSTIRVGQRLRVK